MSRPHVQPGGDSPRPKQPRLHRDEVEITDDLARQLIAAQFPRWGGLRLRRLSTTGTDNAIFRLGSELGVRFPRIHWAVDQVEKEWTWLGHLAARLSTPVPVPVARGEPSSGYPYHWLVYRWLDGTDLQRAEIDDWVALAVELATFVRELASVDTTGGPAAGRRGGSLPPYDDLVRSAIRHLGASLDVDRALAVWEEAVDASSWEGAPVWVHGDLLPGNVLVSQGGLAGVIDWSATGLGDPACDAMIAWAVPSPARAAYREALDFDDATWARARGWVIEQAVLFILYYQQSIPEAVAAARRRLDAVVS